MAKTREELAGLLAEVWDPLHISDQDVAPEREYLYEAEELLALLKGGAATEHVAAYLRKAAARLGPTDATRDNTAAERVMAWWSGADS